MKVRKRQADKCACYILMSSHLLYAGRPNHQKAPSPADEGAALLAVGMVSAVGLSCRRAAQFARCEPSTRRCDIYV